MDRRAIGGVGSTKNKSTLHALILQFILFSLNKLYGGTNKKEDYNQYEMGIILQQQTFVQFLFQLQSTFQNCS
jgi:hypothetical protein